MKVVLYKINNYHGISLGEKPKNADLYEIAHLTEQKVQELLDSPTKVKEELFLQRYIKELTSDTLWRFHPEAKGKWKEDKEMFIKYFDNK